MFFVIVRRGRPGQAGLVRTQCVVVGQALGVVVVVDAIAHAMPLLRHHARACPRLWLHKSLHTIPLPPQGEGQVTRWGGAGRGAWVG